MDQGENSREAGSTDASVDSLKLGSAVRFFMQGAFLLAAAKCPKKSLMFSSKGVEEVRVSRVPGASGAAGPGISPANVSPIQGFASSATGLGMICALPTECLFRVVFCAGACWSPRAS